MPVSTRLVGQLTRLLTPADEAGADALAFFRTEKGEVVRVRGSFVDDDFRARRLQLEGRFTASPAGRIFQVESVWRGTGLDLSDPPLAGLEALLGEIFQGHGFGPGRARKLCETFGEDAWRVLTRHPSKLAEFVGDSEKAWCLHGVLKQEGLVRAGALAHLMAHGLSLAYARRILDGMGSGAVEQVGEDPYVIMRTPGIRFATADRIARERMGVELSDFRRLRALAVSVVDDAAEEGHTSVAWDEALGRVGDQLRETSTGECPDDVLRRTVEAGLLVSDMGDLYLPGLWRAECEAAEAIARLLSRPWRDLPEDWQQASELAAYTEEQVRAVALGCASPICLINGRPGTGKTTVAREIVRLAHRIGVAVTLAATTGKAATRLTESMAEVGLVQASGDQEQTDLFGGSPVVRPAQTVQSLVGNQSPGRALPRGIVIIDEASMMDLPLLARVVANAGSETSLVLLGDPNQLPPVVAGNSARDIRDSSVIPVSELTLVHRQGQASLININAERVLRGEVPLFMGDEISPGLLEDINRHVPSGGGLSRADIRMDCFFVEAKGVGKGADKVVRVVERLRDKGFDPIRSVQVYSPMHRGKMGTVTLNRRLQDVLNPEGEATSYKDRKGIEIRVGDPVIQTKNDREGRGVVNGMKGVVLSRSDSGGLVIDFSGREITYAPGQVAELTLAYASSVHKGQGQQNEATVLVLHHSEHAVMLERSLYYVAQTRAQDLFVCVGTRQALRMSVRTATGTGRRTRLAERTAARLQDRSGSVASPSPSEAAPLRPASPSGILSSGSSTSSPKGRRARPLVDRASE